MKTEVGVRYLYHSSRRSSTERTTTIIQSSSKTKPKWNGTDTMASRTSTTTGSWNVSITLNYSPFHCHLPYPLQECKKSGDLENNSGEGSHPPPICLLNAPTCPAPIYIGVRGDSSWKPVQQHTDRQRIY